VRLRIDGDAPVQIGEVRAVLPAAARLRRDSSAREGLYIYDAAGAQIGYALRTSPRADHIVGYRGPTDTLIVLDRDQRIVGIRIRSSDDTLSHVADVRDDEYFMTIFNGLGWSEAARLDLEEAEIEGVSGATLTSVAMAEGIVHRLSEALGQARTRSVRVGLRDVGTAATLAFALLVAFTHLRGRIWLRRSFQVWLIVYLGFVNGDLIAQALLAGWASSGLPWRIAPGLVLLVAAALVVPWSSRRQLYCGHICPHGAAQELLGRLRLPRLHLSAGLVHGLRWLPAGLLAVVLLVVMLGLPQDLADLEAFDAYLVPHAAVATICVAVVGLIASAFIPQAYCRFGCPTGAVLEFVRSHGRADRFGRGDLVAGLLVLFVALLFWQHRAIHDLLVS
ncbi:MAG: FMN-binding protein, partial [Phycisphaerae bacterium]|nr:FMN-binding protein [Phycisphaerae bacterium]